MIPKVDSDDSKSYAESKKIFFKLLPEPKKHVFSILICWFQ